ncbi:MAG: hypothetical protein AB7E55_19870 [Pigmentiphaga sp.]
MDTLSHGEMLMSRSSSVTDLVSTAASTESANFLDHFDALPDPRQSGKVIYPLKEVLVLSLLAALAEAEIFVGPVRNNGAEDAVVQAALAEAPPAIPRTGKDV